MLELFERTEFAGCRAKVWFDSGATASGKVKFEASSLVIRGTHEGALALRSSATMEVNLKDGVYRFPTTLYLLKNEEMWFTLPKSTTVIREQRRNFVRVPVDIATAFFTESDGEAIEARMLDISGGGALLRARTKAEANETAEIEFALKGVAIRLRANIVRVDTKKQLVALSFSDIKPATRDRIVGFTFKQQSKLRRPGR